MKKLFKLSILLITAVIGLYSCVDDEFDKPPYTPPTYTGPAVTHTIMQLKDSLPADSTIKQITSDIVITGIVSANDESGNIYKYICIQDASGAIEIDINQTSLYNTYPVGQRVYVNCKGLYIGKKSGSIKLGANYNGGIGQIAAIEVSDYLFRDGDPTNTVTSDTITSFTELTDAMQYTLITLKDVSFEDAGKLYSDPNSSTQRNISLSGASSGDIYAYTSSYASFQADTIPSGTGNITGILVKYNSTWEIIIRDLNDVTGFTAYVAPVINGDGSKTNAYTVDDAMVKQGESGVWIKGYIVGVIESDGTNNTANFTGPFTIQSNILIAASPTETDSTKCIPVQLSSGTTVRDSLNLKANSGILGKQVMIYGNLETYFKVPGLKSATAYWWPDTNTGYDPLAGAIFSEPFSSSLGKFSAQSVSGTQTWTYNSSYNCAYMSGYSSGTNYANEDWLISPAINLSSVSSAKLTFDHAKYSGTTNTDITVWVSTDYSSGLPSTATWTQLTISTYPTNYTFVSSGNIDLASYIGNSNVHIAFKYVSTSSSAGTWEMKNFVIKE